MQVQLSLQLFKLRSFHPQRSIFFNFPSQNQASNFYIDSTTLLANLLSTYNLLPNIIFHIFRNQVRELSRTHVIQQMQPFFIKIQFTLPLYLHLRLHTFDQVDSSLAEGWYRPCGNEPRVVKQRVLVIHGSAKLGRPETEARRA